jgi:hypothetical protein
MIKNLFIPNKKNNYKAHLLRKVAVLSYSLILVFVNSFGGFLGIDQAQASTITPANIISLTNQERVAWGLNSLQTNSQLSAAALAKANDMFEKQYWDHFGPNGESPWQFIRAAGYNYVYAGENLAKGFKTSEGVHEAWMASPTHKANIISGNYKDIGVAVVEGVLLGKQTTLVVQMFGNLTTEVYGVAQEPAPEEEVVQTPEPTVPPSSQEKVVVNREAGEIKSIRITSPQEGSVITDSGENIKGDTSNVSGEYTVQVYDDEGLVGDVKSSNPEWEFDKDSDWEEGEHEIKAKIEEYSVESDSVTFAIDSSAPVVAKESIAVSKGDGKYTIQFSIDGDWSTLSLVLGSEILEVEYTDSEEGILIELTDEQVKGSVSIVLADEYGNTSELDISEYFIEEDNQKIIFPALRLNMGDKISVGIVSFVFILLLIEIAVYWKKGRIKDAIGDIFTVGAWWLVITIAIFNGFSGLIN